MKTNLAILLIPLILPIFSSLCFAAKKSTQSPPTAEASQTYDVYIDQGDFKSGSRVAVKILRKDLEIRPNTAAGGCTAPKESTVATQPGVAAASVAPPIPRTYELPKTINTHVIPLKEDDSRTSALHDKLKAEKADFFALGGPDGHLYLVTDPEGNVPPFILSDLAPDEMNPTVAIDYCARKGGHFLAPQQLEVLARAMRQDGVYDKNLIEGMNWTWLFSSLKDDETGLFFYGYQGLIGTYKKTFQGHVRCVLDTTF